MATGYGVCVHIVYEHHAISCTGPRGQAGVNPYRGSAEIVRKSCNFSGVAVQSPQPPDGNHTEPGRLPCKGSAEMVRWPWRHLPFLSVRPPRGARAGIVRCHLRHVYGLRTYDFSHLYNFPLKPQSHCPGSAYGWVRMATDEGFPVVLRSVWVHPSFHPCRSG